MRLYVDLRLLSMELGAYLCLLLIVGLHLLHGLLHRRRGLDQVHGGSCVGPVAQEMHGVIVDVDLVQLLRLFDAAPVAGGGRLR